MRKSLYIVSLLALLILPFCSLAVTDETPLTPLDPTLNPQLPIGVVIGIPTAVPAAATFSSAQSVTLTTSGASGICYTTNGTDPVCATSGASCTTGTFYTIAIPVATTLTIKARSCYPSDNHSTVGSYTYTISSAPPSGGGGGGGSAPPSSTTGSINAMGGVVTLNPEDGTLVRFTAPINAFTGAAAITIARVSNSSSTYTPPAGTTGLFMIGSYVYNITALIGSTSVTTFGAPVTLTFTYTDAQIPAGVIESTLQVYYFDTATNAWVAVTTTIDTVNNTVTITITHLTQFAIFGKKTATGTGTTPTTTPSTVTVEQLQATLNSLIAQLKVLVRAAIARGEILSPALMAYAQDTPIVTVTGKITRDWYMGQTGDEVKIIQSVLAQDVSIYPSGTITGYFGALTKAAVIKFQTKYGIRTTGNVGPLTREKMNTMTK